MLRTRIENLIESARENVRKVENWTNEMCNMKINLSYFVKRWFSAEFPSILYDLRLCLFGHISQFYVAWGYDMVYKTIKIPASIWSGAAIK